MNTVNACLHLFKIHYAVVLNNVFISGYTPNIYRPVFTSVIAFDKYSANETERGINIQSTTGHRDGKTVSEKLKLK